MLKRLRWMLIGALCAGAAYAWVVGRNRSDLPRRAEELARRAGEDALRRGGTAVRDLSARAKDAYREGHQVMEAREEELRREILGEPGA